MTVQFELSTKKVWCGLNVSENCVGNVGLDDCFVDENGQLWDICRPCQEQEQVPTAELPKLRRKDTW